ncbi:hypothetical protein SATMO3_35720 [Sporomusa aerivorans]
MPTSDYKYLHKKLVEIINKKADYMLLGGVL